MTPTTHEQPLNPSSPPELTERQVTEARFHDEWAKSIDFKEIDPEITFEAPTAIECQHVLAQIKALGGLEGKKVLDLGCGSGESGVYFAKRGAEVSACDISPEFIDVAQQLAHHHCVDIQTAVCPAESLPYPDKSFDIVFANGVLHHVDIPLAMKELKRVLKPGGVGFFVEPLPYNPVINVYRWIAKEVRTPDEKPLTFADIGTIRQQFPKTQVDYFWFFTLGVFLYFFLIERASTSERYWKKILYEAHRYKALFNALKALDDAILPVLPLLKPLCWNMVIQIEKGRK